MEVAHGRSRGGFSCDLPTHFTNLIEKALFLAKPIGNQAGKKRPA